MAGAGPERRQQVMTENKNFILAIVLSMLIILGWHYLDAGAARRDSARRKINRSLAAG